MDDAFKREVIANDAGVFRVSLFFDEDPASPREFDSPSVIAYDTGPGFDSRCYDETQSRYWDRFGPRSIADEDVRKARERVREGLVSEAAACRFLRVALGASVVLPLNVHPYRVSTSEPVRYRGTAPDGFVWDDPQMRVELMGEDVAPEVVRAALVADVAVYSRYLEGSYVGYVVERLYDPLDEVEPGEVDESDAWDWRLDDDCWSIDDAEYAWSEALAVVGRAVPVVPVAVLAVQV